MKKLDDLEKQNQNLAEQNKQMQQQIKDLKQEQDSTEIRKLKAWLERKKDKLDE